MEVSGVVLLLAMVAAIFVSTPLLGRYMAKVFGGGEAPGDRVFAPVERLIYRTLRVDEKREQRWTGYAMSLLAFSVVGVVFLYAIQRVQEHLPLNPTDAGGVPPALAWNTAVSFVTNTNWQNYSGESTMSHFTQMAGLTVQNFVSAAVGIAVAVALIRGLTRKGSATIGNFWVDLTRAVTRVLLPLSFVLALVLVSQGVIQNFNGFTEVKTVDNSVAVADADGNTTSVDTQQIPAARSPRRKRSRSSATTAVGRTTPTRRTRSRTRPDLRTSSRSGRCSHCPSPSRTRSACWLETGARAGSSSV
jgi:K+-transporting ATPase ATPase A chain